MMVWVGYRSGQVVCGVFVCKCVCVSLSVLLAVVCRTRHWMPLERVTQAWFAHHIKAQALTVVALYICVCAGRGTGCL
jgi:hypothetical protein